MGLSPEDRRGRFPPSNKTSKEKKDTVRKHLDNMFDYVTHSEQNVEKELYTGSHLKVSKFYSSYLEWCTKQGIPKQDIAMKWLYRHILKTEYKSQFKPLEPDVSDDNV
ncbi:hypothetical protein PYW08_016031 [Mythimna loreyi]|uniref:Uncharacterized protein n=1 Tax=Mythimna loreyi TaxID=667449 RepID=A0ACC2QTD1_9NEOP|nr:hypothetical protein PYW08_016031 [Mythimna loreyi]